MHADLSTCIQKGRASISTRTSGDKGQYIRLRLERYGLILNRMPSAHSDRLCKTCDAPFSVNIQPVTFLNATTSRLTPSKIFRRKLVDATVASTTLSNTNAINETDSSVRLRYRQPQCEGYKTKRRVPDHETGSYTGSLAYELTPLHSVYVGREKRRLQKRFPLH